MNDQPRVMYYIGKKQDGSIYPGRAALYPLEMLPVDRNMNAIQRKEVYAENCRRATEKFRSNDAFENYSVCNASGWNGNIVTKDGQIAKVSDVVNAFLTKHGLDSKYNNPIGLFFNYTCITALHQQFLSNPEDKVKFDRNTAFFDNNATYQSKISSAEAMCLYAYLDRTNQLEKVLGNIQTFRETVLNDYYIPQIENNYKKAKWKAGKKYYDENGPKYPEAKNLYAMEVTKAEEKRAEAYEKLGINPPSQDNEKSKAEKNTAKTYTTSAKPTRPATKTEKSKIGKSEVERQIIERVEKLKAEQQKVEQETTAKVETAKPNTETREQTVTSQEAEKLSLQDIIPTVQEPTVEKNPIRDRKRVRKNLFKTNSYKLKVAKEMLNEEDRIDSLMRARGRSITSEPIEEAQALKKGDTRVVAASSSADYSEVLGPSIEELLSHRLVKPEEITILVNTEEAASECRRYILDNKELDGKNINVATVDVMARSIIDKYAEAKMPEFFDKDSQCSLLNHSAHPFNSSNLYNKITEQMELTSEEASFLEKNLEDAVANIRLAPWSERQLEETSRLYSIKPEALKLAMEMYSKTKLEEQKVDREDIILKAMEILETDPTARAEVQSQCKALLIPDYQDILPLQRAFEKLIKPDDGIKIETIKDHRITLPLSRNGVDFSAIDVEDNDNVFYELPSNSISLQKCGIADIGKTFESERQEQYAIVDEVSRRLENHENPSDIVILCNGDKDKSKIKDALKLDYNVKDKLEENIMCNPLKFELYQKNKMPRPSYFRSKEEIEANTKKHATTVMYGIKSLAEPSNPVLFNKFMQSADSLFNGVDNDSVSPLEDFVKANTTGAYSKDQRALKVAKAYWEAMKCEMAADAIKTFLEKTSPDKDYKCIELLEKCNVPRTKGLDFIESMEAELAAKPKVPEKFGIRVRTLQEAKSIESGTVFLYGDARNVWKTFRIDNRGEEQTSEKENKKSKAKIKERD